MSDTSKYTFDDCTVVKAFTNYYYVVPDYQREYVWTDKDQVNRLLTDIYEAYDLDSEKEYFIGTTVAYNNKGVAELIDGQQRTTTLFLMLCAFVKLYTEFGEGCESLKALIANSVHIKGKDTYKYRLELQYPEATEILQAIHKCEDIQIEKLPASSKRLKLAYDFILTSLREKIGGNVEELCSLCDFFEHRVKFIQIMTPDINDALKIFETINARGVGLTPMDLLKNLIFRQVGRSEFEKLKSLWKQLIQIIESNNEKPLRFLRYFILSNYPEVSQGSSSSGQNVVREDEIYKWFTKHDDRVGYTKDPIAFVNLLIENAKAFVNFAKGKDAYGKDNVFVNNMALLGGTAFRQHIILLLTARTYPEDMFNLLARNLENFLYIYLLSKEQAKIFEKIFGEWAISLADISTMEQLKNFIMERMLPRVEKKETEYRDHFLNLNQNEIQNFRLKYILAKLTQFVDDEHEGATTVSPLEHYYSSKTEIEHILPQTPFSEEEKAKFEDYDKAKTMFGNLTLIGKTSNSSLRNKPFAEKVTKYGIQPYYLTKSMFALDTVGVNTRLNAINAYLRTFSEWNIDAINERQRMLYELSKLVWRLDVNASTKQSAKSVVKQAGNSKAPNKEIRVTLPTDEVIYKEGNAAATFAATIRALDPQKVASLGIDNCKMPLVRLGEPDSSNKYRSAHHDVGNGYFVNTHSGTMGKVEFLKRIADGLGITLKIEIL